MVDVTLRSFNDASNNHGIRQTLFRSPVPLHQLAVMRGSILQYRRDEEARWATDAERQGTRAMPTALLPCHSLAAVLPLPSCMKRPMPCFFATMPTRIEYNTTNVSRSALIVSKLVSFGMIIGVSLVTPPECPKKKSVEGTSCKDRTFSGFDSVIEDLEGAPHPINPHY